MWMGVRAGVCAAMVLGLMVMGGCPSQPKGDVEPAQVVRKDPPPRYADAAARHNERVKYLDRVLARANIRLTYFDEGGEEHTENPEGRLQVVRPDRLALSLGKAGQTLFWFGCDGERYWWIDLSDRNKRVAAVGRHEKFDDQTARRIGLPIKPLDLIRLLGVSELDVNAAGVTQWSADGTQVGVTTPLGARGWQRMWLDAETFEVREVEIFGRDRALVLSAVHEDGPEGPEYVEFTRDVAGARQSHASMPSRVYITHVPTGTEARLTISGVKDGPISDKAFDLSVLLEKQGVDRVIDVDERGVPVPPLRAEAGGRAP